MTQTGTLEELNVWPGDVVEWLEASIKDLDAALERKMARVDAKLFLLDVRLEARERKRAEKE